MNLNTDTVKTYFKGLADIAIKLIATPVDFFRTMPKSGGLLDPMFFLVVTVLIDVIMIFIESFVKHGVSAYGLGMLVGALAIISLIALILSFFVAGALYVIWSFMGSNESYETSYRCMAYMQIIVPIAILISVVPYLGLLCIAWWLYLMVIATKVVHNLPAKPALLVFGVIAALGGLAYYNSVSSTIKAKEHLQEITRELQKMPGTNGTGNSGKR
jgi:hypothetical protein